MKHPAIAAVVTILVLLGSVYVYRNSSQRRAVLAPAGQGNQATVTNAIRRDSSPPPAAMTSNAARPVEELVGIGAMLKADRETQTIRIMNLVPDSPAAKAGLTAGLILSKVNGEEMEGVRLEECIERVRGPAGSTVRVEVIDPETKTTNSVDITRERLRL